MNFFKKKPVILDAYTLDPTIFRLARPDHANKFFPDWWKTLPKTVSVPGTRVPFPTVKTCRGIIDYYDRGIVIPMWTDSLISVSDKFQKKHTITSAQQNPNPSTLPPEQWRTWISDKDFGHIKYQSPWYFNCKEDIKFVFTHPMYNSSTPQDYLVLPGVVDFKYQHESNVNIMVEYQDKTRDIMIHAGDPLVNIFPLTEREVIINHHLVTKEELEKITLYPVVFRGVYNFFKKNIQRMEEEEKAKCPFHFGKK